jgi:hypothetical protein
MVARDGRRYSEREITMTFMAWPEIEAFHNVRKFIRVDPGEWYLAKEQLSGTSTVEYRCKVKLHGTNAAVQVPLDHFTQPIVCQSRESIITPEKDNAGFARWVDSNKAAWRIANGWIIYGEWCGPGIQKNVAVAEVSKKFFAVFAARPLGESDTIVVEPERLAFLVQGIPDVYVLPWYSRPVAHGSDTSVAAKLDINWRQTDEDLTKSTVAINDWVLAVEACDPWVEATFGNKGTGEGLVFYPVSEPHQGWETFQNLVFKAKGEAHKNIKTAAPAQVNAEVAASVDAFAELVLTQARLEQGARTVALTPGSYDQQQTGKFVSWVLADVEKETQDELAASNLTMKQVTKPLMTVARKWYLEKARR